MFELRHSANITPVPTSAPVRAPNAFARRVSTPSTNRPPSTPMNRPMTLIKASNSDLISGLTKTNASSVPRTPISNVTERAEIR